MSRFQGFQAEDEPIFKPQVLGGQGQDDEQEDPAPAPEAKASRLEEKFGQMMESVTQGNLANKLLADPNIIKYLEAKQQGRSAKIEIENPAGVEPVKEPEGDPEEMSNSELADFMMQKVSARMNGQLEKLFTKVMEPLQTQIQQLQLTAQSMRGSGIQQEIKTVQSKYSDFDVYRKAMADIAAKAGDGTFSVEQLYKMAKSLQGDDPERVGNPASERPSNFSGRVQGAPRQPTQASNGRQNKGLPEDFRGRSGFKNMLSQYLSSQE